MKFTLAILFPAAALGLAATTALADPAALRFWTDVTASNCIAANVGTVVSAKDAKDGNVLVTVKLKQDGKKHVSTVNGATAKDFPAGSAFCAQDK